MAIIHRVIIEADECKGCGFCIHACPAGVLEFSKKLNSMGYHYAVYTGEGCTGCGICYYTCPETGAITVIRNVEGLDKGFCEHCNKEVHLLPDYRDPDRKRCIDCGKPVLTKQKRG